jgi:hypothetical protein
MPEIIQNYMGALFLVLVVTVYFLCEIGNACLLWVNDKKHSSLIRRFVPKLIENSSWDDGAWLVWPFLLYGLAIFLGALWQLFIFCLIVGAFLFLVRLLIRLKRSLVKAGIAVDLGSKEEAQEPKPPKRSKRLSRRTKNGRHARGL